MAKFISYNKTIVKLNKKRQIKKIYKINTIPVKYYKYINNEINKYYTKLSKCKNIPRLIKNKKNLEFYFEYCGNSLFDILQAKKLTKVKMEKILYGVTQILNFCEKNKINIDPHFKNFTILNNNVYFVDIFPPLTKKYIQLLTHFNKKIKNKIIKHLNTWNYQLIKQHFIADLKKSKFINRNFYLFAKKYFVKNKLIKKISYKKINRIIAIEESNLKNNKFTLS